MKIGPLEVIICAFPKPAIDANVVKALSETVKSGAIALADLVLVSRDRAGRRACPRPARRPARGVVRNDP